MSSKSSKEETKTKKLVLCFDGTGNQFTGSNEDTNVVKILSKLDRNADDQFHYYQTGIGTYDVNDESVNKSTLGGMQSSISKIVDQGFGTTFDAHVLAGYRFLMRYYDSGDKIYIFGFSRGAYTAQFLARMINTVGLLCKGNEEMAPFAYKLYQRYLTGEFNLNATDPVTNSTSNMLQNQATDNNDLVIKTPRNDETSMHPYPCEDHSIGIESNTVARNEVLAFSDTFCRKDKRKGQTEDTDIKVFFLGLWDCVSSVAVLEQKTPVVVPVVGTAHHVRHAVSIDERRVKFKPVLFAQDQPSAVSREDIKEVWFPGCHGDVGGGWPTDEQNPFDCNDDKKMNFWERLKHIFWTRGGDRSRRAVNQDRLQLSDVPLAWMIHEVKNIDKKKSNGLTWRQSLDRFEINFANHKRYAMRGPLHDSLRFGCGTSFYKVLLWKLMEWLPLFPRLELVDGEWKAKRFPPNCGSTRDIPKNAKLHESVLWRLNPNDISKGLSDLNYSPNNSHGDMNGYHAISPCLIHGAPFVECDFEGGSDNTEVNKHRTYKFRPDASDTESLSAPA